MSDRFEEFLRRAAADYNDPPEPPREAMWQAIQAKRAAAAVPSDEATAAPYAGATVRPSANGRRPGGARERAARRWGGQSWASWTVGLAAMLMIGFGLGRLLPIGSPAADPAASVPPPSAAVAAEPAGPGPELADAGSGSEGRGTEPPAPSGGDAGAAAASAPTAPPAVLAASGQETGDSQAATSSDVLGEPGPGDARPARESGQIYRFAAGATLSQAEALLTAYRADAASGRVDPQIARWARDVLSTTRLLLDSPAGADPRLAQLLEDLELVLVQVVQLGGEPAGQELDLIDETMEQRDMLPRLRTAIPAGPVAVGTD